MAVLHSDFLGWQPHADRCLGLEKITDSSLAIGGVS